MKFFLFIIFSAVTLTLFGIISYSEKCAQDAKQYREQRRIELSSKHNDSDFWPTPNTNMVVTFPKKKPVLVAIKPSPTPKPEPTPEPVYRERVITARDYRKEYVYNKKWVNGREVDVNYQTNEEKELNKRYFGL